ncbi:MAG: AAA family ATPase [Boseongicola sp. SB0670_bin_30]|nr:AAA family ATPase [Boseongicola sp. SB0670_bin_30]
MYGDKFGCRVDHGSCGGESVVITRIEIDGFKTFENFKLDLRPFTAVVGPNASGKSNLFDAIKFVSRLAQTDIREAMQELRGRPEELFRRTATERSDRMAFAVEVLLEPHGTDPFGKSFELRSQRVRYELEIAVRTGVDRRLEGVYVHREQCSPIRRKEERGSIASDIGAVKYGQQSKPFIATRSESSEESNVIEIRQDGPGKRGRPLALSAKEASRTGLSTVTTAEFPHLYALRTLLSSIQFLQVDPQASRRATDRLAPRRLLPDASNLATVLAKLMEETRSDMRPDGLLSDVVTDLSSLIPSVARLVVRDDPGDSEYSFALQLADSLSFSSRVISDGTLRLLALVTILNDPQHGGILCWEEPENGVHEARIPALMELIRTAAGCIDSHEGQTCFQILVNTHSPVVMSALQDCEVVASDVVSTLTPGTQSRTSRTRMRRGVSTDSESGLTRSEVEGILRRHVETA